MASFAAAPRPDQVATLREAGTATIVTVGAPRHAEKMAGIGVDAVIAQGAEGGGHTGTIPTALLVPGVVAATAGSGLVVLAAGGMRDGSSLAAARCGGRRDRHGHPVPAHRREPGARPREGRLPGLGAQLHSRHPGDRRSPQRVIRTDVIDGLESALGPARLVRAASNALRFSRASGTSPLDLLRSARAMHANGERTWSQVLLAANAPMMTKASVVDGDLDVGILPTGQVVGSIADLPTVDHLVTEIMADASSALRAVCSSEDPATEHPTSQEI
ncbi:MAG: nitronate monooxygenase [Microthrixaceae bacterium]